MVRRKKNYSKQPHLWLRKETKTWYIVFRNGPKKVRICTKTRDKREAEVALDRFLKTEYHIPGFERRQITLHQGIASWLKSCERSRRGLAFSTLRLYRHFDQKLREAFPERLLAVDVTRRDVRKFLDEQEDAGVSLKSIKRLLTGLKMVFNYLIEEEIVAFNPAQRFKVFAPSERHKAMPESLYLGMISAMKKEGERDLVELTEVIWHSGLRFIETTRLTWEDINFPASVWTIRSPKNKGGVKSIPFREEVRTILFRRYQRGEPMGPFHNQYHHYQSLWKAFRNRNPEFLPWKFHCLRHSFISRLRSQGSDAAAMVLARHSSSAMSDLYTHMELENMRKELEAI